MLAITKLDINKYLGVVMVFPSTFLNKAVFLYVLYMYVNEKLHLL